MGSPSSIGSHIDRNGRRRPLTRQNFGGTLRGVSIQPPETTLVGAVDGLKKIKSIVLESPPELDSQLLMQLLGNPNVVASNLTSLELRFCKLGCETLSKLMYHMPPNVKRFVLLRHPDEYDDYHNIDTKLTHLCPLVRNLAKNLVHFEFGAPAVCREMFFDDADMQSLRGSAIETGVGAYGGAINKSLGSLDEYAIKETIENCRRQKRSKYRTSQINQAINDTVDTVGFNSVSAPLTQTNGNYNTSPAAARAHRETESLLDQAEESRSRTIRSAKPPWFRRIITWDGLCSSVDTWEELRVAADLEEQGIDWILASTSFGAYITIDRSTNVGQTSNLD